MNIQKIYDQYSIPLNLQEHMYRVAAVGKIICENVTELKVDTDVIVKTLLLHDMGNIIKFNFERVDILVDKDKKRVDELKIAQKNYIAKYGSDPDVATVAIIQEITSDTSLATLCTNFHWECAHEFIGSEYWDRKIACYSDMRVGPFGVIPLHARFDDLQIRRPEEKESLDVLREQGVQLEKEIQGIVNIDLQDISDEMVESVIDSLKDIEI